MYEAYNHGKDLYAMIAQSAYHNNYEDNLEFFPEGTELEIDGQKVIAGSGKECVLKIDTEDTITIKYYELLETHFGDVSAQDLKIGDKIISNIGDLTISNKVQNIDDITLTFSI